MLSLLRTTQIIREQSLHLILILTIGLLFTQCSEDSRVKTFLEVQAKTVNLKCPMKVDHVTTLNKCEVVGNRTFRYSYTVNSNNTIDTTHIKSTLRGNMISKLKIMRDVQKFRDYEVNIEYIYNDTEGNKIFQIDIAPDEYK